MAYESLAAFYDHLMVDVSMQDWVDFVLNLMHKQNHPIHHILELGCGTGNATLELVKRGHEVVAMERSGEMITLAASKLNTYDQQVILLHQDMVEFELDIYEIETILAFNDVVNYITNAKSLKRLFRQLYQHMAKEGVFIFDISSLDKILHKLNEQTIYYTFEQDQQMVHMIWENDFNNRSKLLTMHLHFFVEQPNGLFRLLEEEQVQRGYLASYLVTVLEEIGFMVTLFTDFSFHVKDLIQAEQSDRIFFYCQKKGSS